VVGVGLGEVSGAAIVGYGLLITGEAPSYRAAIGEPMAMGPEDHVDGAPGDDQVDRAVKVCISQESSCIAVRCGRQNPWQGLETLVQ
jgi:hypothetical protein